MAFMPSYKSSEPVRLPACSSASCSIGFLLDRLPAPSASRLPIGLDGDAEDEAGADGAVFYGQVAAVGLGDLAGDGKPEARAIDVLVAGGLQPGEALEDDLPVFGGDARSVVLHLEDGDVVL